jgi:hypothetical protein
MIPLGGGTGTLLQKIIFWCVFVALAVNRTTALDLDMARFATAKKNQVRELAETQTNKVPPIVWRFFDAVRTDDWETATNLAERIGKGSGRYATSNDDAILPSLQTAIWPPICETVGAYEQFHDWDKKWVHRFGNEIIASIPKGSIYFGGTDPGRFVVSVLSEDQREGRSFFTLTQNQLVDKHYLEYLEAMYGKRIYIPSRDDFLTAFSACATDVESRSEAGKLRPGEFVRTLEDGRVEVSGDTAIMEINGLLAKVILEKNPDREFYIEESFPLDWMYPYLSPHGLIMELSHKPLSGISVELVQKDHEYWKSFVGELIGDWINEKTSTKEVCDFADNVYREKDFGGFKWDAGFAKNDEAQKCFSKLRSSIAGLYVWRAENTTDESERDRMRMAADLAFRQSLALCPYSPEAVFRYTQFLKSLKRPDEALLIAETWRRFEPDNPQLKELIKSLRKAE